MTTTDRTYSHPCAQPSTVDVVVRAAAGCLLPWSAGDVDVELTLHHPAATIADLAAALAGPPDGTGGSTLLVDGRVTPSGLPLRASPLRRGSVIATPVGPAREPSASADAATDGARPVVALRTVAGPDAGRLLPLGVGAHVVGRAGSADVALDDPELARRQAVLEVGVEGGIEVTDLCAPRPTRIGGAIVDGVATMTVGAVLDVGATLAEVVEVAAGAGDGRTSTDEVGGSTSWTEPLRRPPRTTRAGPASPVPVPATNLAGPVSGPFGLAAVVTGLVAGAAAALILHQPAFLLLSAVGAAGTLGVALWQRITHGRRGRAARRQEREVVARFAEDLAQHQAAVARVLRSEAVELSDAVTCAHERGVGLWARRNGDPGAYTAVVGRGQVVRGPALAGDASRLPAGAWALVEAASVLDDVPVAIDLGPGAVVGVVGPAAVAWALARSLVIQLAVTHGPADLLVAGLSACRPRPEEERWMRWLPHSGDPATGESLTAAGPGVVELLDSLDRTLLPAQHLLLVADDPSLLSARNTAARQLLASDPSAAALVVAGELTELPSICQTVVEVRTDGRAAIHRPQRAELADHARLAGSSAVTARSVALALARWHDPEQPAGGACVPGVITLADLLDGSLRDAERMAAGWRAGGDDPPLRTLLAMAADGPVEVDLGRDGPHALVAGTTGSGKSELLRSFVAGLAAGTSPDHLAFVLIDYKGGAAFDACADLPHVVGVVTDLDEHLAERALRSLAAELRRRERILRDAGAADLTSYRAVGGRPPLPRLVVVVDEFATLVADLPAFVPALVGLAQRGRSLGVHLVLATQRPAGAIGEDIRANTNLRIALRVQDAADSVDVVGDPLAASLPRHRPGRAVLRFGPGEVLLVQIAASCGPDLERTGQAITLEPIGCSTLPEADGATGATPRTARSATVLEVLVDAARRAAAGHATGDRHRPWLPALPREVSWEALPAGASALLDEPDQQRQTPWTWNHQVGHLLCIGTVGSGTTTALATIALAAAVASPPDALHLYVVDGGSDLAALAELPHVGASIRPAEHERQARLLARLGSLLDEDRALEARAPVVIIVDRLEVWRQAVAENLGPELADLLDRILVEGPAAGIVVAGGLDRPGALPLSVSGAVGERLIFRLADPADAVVAGIRPAAGVDMIPGRARLAGRSGLELQVARADDLPGAVRAAAHRWMAHDASGVAPVIDCLPLELTARDLPAPSAGHPWLVPLGLESSALVPARVTFHGGDHLLICGPARSGRSSALDPDRPAAPVCRAHGALHRLGPSPVARRRGRRAWGRAL